MKKKIQESIFSLSGASISIGVLGFLSSFATLFVDMDFSISKKWFFLILFLFFSLVLILLKVIYDFSQKSAPLSLLETPIKYVEHKINGENERIFVIKRNDNFISNTIVGCYVQQGKIERLAYLGNVHLLQDKVIQIKIRYDFKILDTVPQKKRELGKIFVKSVVPVEALSYFNNQESSDE